MAFSSIHRMVIDLYKEKALPFPMVFFRTLSHSPDAVEILPYILIGFILVAVVSFLVFRQPASYVPLMLAIVTIFKVENLDFIFLGARLTITKIAFISMTLSVAFAFFLREGPSFVERVSLLKQIVKRPAILFGFAYFFGQLVLFVYNFVLYRTTPLYFLRHMFFSSIGILAAIFILALSHLSSRPLGRGGRPLAINGKWFLYIVLGFSVLFVPLAIDYYNKTADIGGMGKTALIGIAPEIWKNFFLYIPTMVEKGQYLDGFFYLNDTTRSQFILLFFIGATYFLRKYLFSPAGTKVRGETFLVWTLFVSMAVLAYTSRYMSVILPFSMYAFIPLAITLILLYQKKGEALNKKRIIIFFLLNLLSSFVMIGTCRIKYWKYIFTKDEEFLSKGDPPRSIFQHRVMLSRFKYMPDAPVSTNRLSDCMIRVNHYLEHHPFTGSGLPTKFEDLNKGHFWKSVSFFSHILDQFLIWGPFFGILATFTFWLPLLLSFRHLLLRPLDLQLQLYFTYFSGSFLMASIVNFGREPADMAIQIIMSAMFLNYLDLSKLGLFRVVRGKGL